MQTSKQPKLGTRFAIRSSFPFRHLVALSIRSRTAHRAGEPRGLCRRVANRVIDGAWRNRERETELTSLWFPGRSLSAVPEKCAVHICGCGGKSTEDPSEYGFTKSTTHPGVVPDKPKSCVHQCVREGPCLNSACWSSSSHAVFRCFITLPLSPSPGE